MEPATDYLSHYIDRDKKLLYSKWLREISSDEYHEGMQKLYELICNNGLTHWLHDISIQTQHSQEDQKWSSEDFALMLIQSGLKYMAIVIPENPTSKQTGEMLRDKSYRIFGKTVLIEFFDSVETATAWLLPNLQHYRIPQLKSSDTQLDS
ncbi:hypothetical protein [Pontibacter vulgaris]|uniref:hypothetical protein n=1 Tax=Pontibacter vulgaris TaxID=2905679 RepID=UPI001FA6D9FB|nr:hypothetical protein [Pontibacter vulgaris]